MTENKIGAEQLTDNSGYSNSATAFVRPRQFGVFNTEGLKTLYLREVRRFLKVGMQTLLAPVVSALLFMVIFKLAFPQRADINGIHFADYIAPGIIMMAILNNAFQNTSSSLAIAKVQGNTTDFLMAPLSSLELTLGFLGGAVTRGILVGAITLVCIALMGAADVSVHSVLALVYYSVVASFMMAAIGLVGGIWADKFDHLAAITNFIIMPMTMLSGTFYPISVFAEPFESLSHFNPFFHLIDGFRYAFTGMSEGNLLVGGVAVFFVSLALCIWSWYLLRTGYKLKA